MSFDNEVEKAIITLSKIKDEELSSKTTKILTSYLYTPDKRLIDYLRELEQKIVEQALPKEKRPNNINSEIGRLLEIIALLSFKGLKGVNSIRSFQSSGPQYDLLVSGDGPIWLTICDLLFIDKPARDILIESKALSKKVGDNQFARLCNLLDLNLFSSGGLGIFFTIKGATGFPDSCSSARMRSLRDSKLRQVIYKYKTGKPIIVFDLYDIKNLTKPGSLVPILIEKIREIEYQHGIDISKNIDEPVKTDLPPHLRI